MTQGAVRLNVWRGDAEGGRLVPFEVPVEEGMVVLDAVLWIQAHHAPDLAIRWNCKAAHCGSCSAEVEGFPVLMCKTRVDHYGHEFSVRPMRSFPIIRDLVTDVSRNYKVSRQIPAFSPRPPVSAASQPWRMSANDVGRLIEFRKCIECFLCQDVCHVLREHHREASYYGPRFFVQLAALEMHPKDTASRIELLKGGAGLGLCNVTKCCTEVCPQHIRITDNAIIPLKERVADRHFDPLRRVARALRHGNAETPDTNAGLASPTDGVRPEL